MSKKHYVEDFDDMDDSTLRLLGSKVTKLSTGNHGKDRFRERRAGHRDERYAPSPRIRRARDRF